MIYDDIQDEFADMPDTEFDENQIVFLGTRTKEQLMRLVLIEQEKTRRARRRANHYEWQVTMRALDPSSTAEPPPAPFEGALDVPDDINFLTWWAEVHGWFRQ